MTTRLKIARAYTILVAASLVGHALSLLKEILAANYFGVSNAMDAFYAALTLPNLISSVLLSPFSIIFIPIIVKYRLKDLRQAGHIVSTIANLLIAMLLLASALTFVFSSEAIALISPGLAPDTAADAALMLRIISAGIVFTGAVNILTGIMNAFEHFLWPAISGMFITVATILLIVFMTDRLGIFVLGWGLLAGTILQFLFLLPKAMTFGIKPSISVDLSHPEIRRGLALSVTFILISVLSGMSTVINRFIASWLPVGSIAALGYADKLVQVPIIIFSGAIATSIYPFLSAQAAENRVDEMRDTVALSLRMSGFIFIPLAAIMMVLARPAIALLFQRGAFDAAATDLTAAIFSSYCLLLLSNYAVTILQRLLFAFQDFRSFFYIILATLALHLALAVGLTRVMDPPACGIALAGALTSMIIAPVYFLVLKRRIQNLHGLSILKSLAPTLCFAAAAGLASSAAYKWLSAPATASVTAQVLVLAAAAAAGAAVFAGLAAAFRMEEFEKVSQLAANKLGLGKKAS